MTDVPFAFSVISCAACKHVQKPNFMLPCKNVLKANVAAASARCGYTSIFSLQMSGNILGVAKSCLARWHGTSQFEPFSPKCALPDRCDTEGEVACLLHPTADLQYLDSRQGNELQPHFTRTVSWNLKHLKLAHDSYKTGEHPKHCPTSSQASTVILPIL